MKISADKSQAILFTPNSREFKLKPEIYYEGSLIPVENQIKILGLNLDTMHTGTPHLNVGKTKGCAKVKILKAAQGSDFGLSKEDGLLTYKALVSPVLGFGGPLWFPLRSPLKNPVAQLQTVQNPALRSVTGCHAAASQQHLLDECQVLSVYDHVAMQCRQFLANTRQAHHPSNEVTSRPPGLRPNRKPTLQHCFGRDIERFVSEDGNISQFNYKRAVKELHKEAVSAALESAGPNRLLGTRPPLINPAEASLSRPFRTTLSCLRSDFCKDLASYSHFINDTVEDTCPLCLSAPQTVSHLFSCSAAPTDLVPTDLWMQPREASSLLAPLPSFSHLPPLAPPLPRPPPEPPPPGGAGSVGLPLCGARALFLWRFRRSS